MFVHGYTKNTLSLTTIFEMTIVITKHTQNTIVHFQNPSFSKTRHLEESEFDVDCYGAMNILYNSITTIFLIYFHIVEGRTA